MSTPKDIFRWLHEIERDLGDDAPLLHQLGHQLIKAQRDYDDEGIMTVSREYQRLAQAHDQPWLGVYGRHWELQFRLIMRNEGMTAVADAVSAFEQANRPENGDCPQSICTTQDLCIAYGNVDGPGYADETLAAATDTLARIDTSWPCWDCLSVELVRSLEHQQEWEQVLAKLTQVELQLRSAGQRPSLEYMNRRLAALLELGRNEEALVAHDETVVARYAQHSEDAEPLRRVLYGRILHRLGRTEEAIEILRECPSPVEKPPYEKHWRQLVDELVATGDLDNSDALAATRIRIGMAHQRVGSWRSAFNTFAEVASHAAQRGAVDTAHRARVLCVEAMEQLVKPLDAPEKLTAVDAAIAAAPSEISEAAPGERRIAELQAQIDTAFDADAFSEIAGLLAWLGWDDAAVELLWDRIRQEPSESSTTYTMIGVLQSRGGPDRERDFNELADLIQDADPPASHWVRAVSAAQSERWADCAEACAHVVALDGGAVNTRRMWATAERNCGNHAEASRLSSEILERTAIASLGDLTGTEIDVEAQEQAYRAQYQRTDDIWWALVHHTLAEDWAAVRAVGAEMGMQFETEAGPIDERWESCAITMRDDDGEERSHLALRTGPVTAEIMTVTFPGRQQRVKDRVVFDPKPLDPPPEDPEEARTALRRYQSLHTVSPGDFTAFTVESAIDEGDEAVWPVLRDALYSAGFQVWSYDAGRDKVAATGEEASVLLLAVAHGPDSSPKELHDQLTTLMADWQYPVAWPDLAEAAGEDHEAHRERLRTMWVQPD